MRLSLLRCAGPSSSYVPQYTTMLSERLNAPAVVAIPEVDAKAKLLESNPAYSIEIFQHRQADGSAMTSIPGTIIIG